jgi:lipocalin
MVEYKYLFAVLLAAAIISIVGVSLTQAQQGLTTEAGEGVTADLPFIKNIDFYKFQGIWYEIASKPNIIEKKCLCGQSLD